MKKKVHIHYMEDEDVRKHMDKQPFHLKSSWIREATRSKMDIEKLENMYTHKK
jgi:hypothetical protein